MKKVLFVCAVAISLWVLVEAVGQEGQPETPVSEATGECLTCHEVVSPGTVADWRRSRHARTTPAQALQKKEVERRISATTIPDNLAGSVVGCAECHNLNPDSHKDTFEHGDRKVHTVVSPPDCAVCHPIEAQQYGENIMAQAYGNLKNNPVFMALADSINGPLKWKGGKLESGPPNDHTEEDSCLACHGTKVEVSGTKERETDFGEMEFPVLSGWPSQGCGRINPDDSKGACTSCHTRHQFSIEMARKPATCSQCHKGPDVPAYKVYEVSKHGNIYSSLGSQWDFAAVPWKVGEDFAAPTCAACHVSLLTDGSGEVVSRRTHRMNDRLKWRIFGLIYAHAHPRLPDTTIMKNKAGLPLPAELTGEPASEHLIPEKEQRSREAAMKRVCLSCHATDWVESHFARLENTIKTTNDATLTATRIMLDAWKKGAARGLSQKDSIFNEAIEKKWVEQWLFYANSTRYASAMGGADYGAFANGRWYLKKNICEMADWLEFKTRSSAGKDK